MEISTVFKIKTNVATQQPAYTCVLLLSTIFFIFNKLGIYVYVYTYIHYIYVYIIYIIYMYIYIYIYVYIYI